MRAETWIKLGVKPEEIQESPKDVTSVIEENNNLRETVEEKAVDLYNKMGQRLAHSGNDYTEVGRQQKYRQLTQIQ